MSSKYRERRLACTWSSASLCMCMLALVLAPVPASSGERPSITLRAGPGEQYAIIATVPAASSMEFTIFDEHDAWSRVRVPSDEEGWRRLGARPVTSPAVDTGLDRTPTPASPAVPPATFTVARRPKPAPVSPAATSTGERPSFTLRAGPGEQYAIIATVPAASSRESTIFDEHDAWSRMRVPSGEEGWLRFGARPVTSPAVDTGLDRTPTPASPAVPPATFTVARRPKPAPVSPAATSTGERPSITLRAGPGEQYAIIATVPAASSMEFTIFD